MKMYETGSFGDFSLELSGNTARHSNRPQPAAPGRRRRAPPVTPWLCVWEVAAPHLASVPRLTSGLRRVSGEKNGIMQAIKCVVVGDG